MVSLCYLKAMGHELQVITEDENVVSLAESLGLTVFDSVPVLSLYDFDIFICVHGRSIIPKEKMVNTKMINIHPALFKYRGHNPIKRFILNEDTQGSVESQWMVDEVDAGDVIHQEFFETPKIKTYQEYYDIALPYYFKCLKATLDKIL